MANFLPAFGRILIYEGGYVKDPDDPGGETKYGISKRSYPDLDIPKLTLDEAHKIYLRDFWESLNLSKIASQEIAEEVLEQAIHMGRNRAAEILQASLNTLGFKLVVDGIVGPKTLNAVNSFKDTQAFLKVLNVEQYNYYKGLIERKPKLAKYIRGWLRRVEI